MTVFTAGFGIRILHYHLDARNRHYKSRQLQSRAARQADYYQVLELDSKSATIADIKASYRRLARKWHPDVSTAPEAATIFQILTRAFEVLSDEERRADYDKNLASSPTSTTSQKSSTGVLSTLTLSIQEAVLGGLHKVKFLSLSQCSRCKGSGGAPGGRSEKCQICKGRGDIFKTRNNNATGETSTALIECPACCGKGLLIIDCCPKCNGIGLFRTTREIELRVPAGVENGTTLKVAGYGDAKESGGLKDDLIIQITVLPCRELERIGMDLYSEVRIPLFLAILGGQVQVQTLLNGPKLLRIPPGTSHGSQLSLAKEGVLGKGTQHYKVRIEVPRELDERENELILQLAGMLSPGGDATEK
jgi:molecular chaperone DnaJ